MNSYIQALYCALTKSTVGTGYVQVEPIQEHFETINGWISKHNGVALGDLHVTLLYDPSNPELPEIDDKVEYTATIKGLELFGPEKDVLVMTLESEELQKRHQEYLDAGAKDSWPEYKPHITLIPKVTDDDTLKTYEDDLDFIIKKLPKITLHREQKIKIRDN